jgi:murein DD-endopeptidase MepM/ murein hydrolase activator NlpD
MRTHPIFHQSEIQTNKAGALLFLVLVFLHFSNGAAWAQTRIDMVPLRQHFLPKFEELQSHGQLGPDFDAENLLERIAEKYNIGKMPEQVSEFVNEEIQKSFFSFTNTDSKHDVKAVYALPFDEKIPRLLTVGQGSGGHRGREFYYSFDFAMPIGTPVLAARSGVVARVVHGYTESGLKKELVSRANQVIILHDDGSFARYAHLSLEGLATPGSQVDSGQRIGFSGNTGLSSGPHLHFSVAVLREDYQKQSVFIRFSIDSKPVFKLRNGEKYP